MQKAMKRRQFLAGSAAAAGALLLAPRWARAGSAAGEWKGYTEVDAALFQGINRVKDPSNKSVLEKKHVPVIEAPETVKSGEPFDVKVTVGETVHPMIQAHYIQYVELVAGNEPAGRVEFSAKLGVPQVTFTLKLDKPVTLVAREYCNLHGLWESHREVKVS